MDDAGQHEAQGLAGPRLRDPHEVLAGEGDGEALGLDGGRGREPGTVDLNSSHRDGKMRESSFLTSFMT